jgi:NitT/TauT family transport system ATP-binding protein
MRPVQQRAGTGAVTDPKSMFISIDNVSKTYRSRGGAIKALDHVNVDIDQSQFISVVGPSGCGKSTLLMIVSGLIPPSSGAVRISGNVVAGPHTDLGIVFQQDVLLDWRNVLQNVMLQAEIRRLARPEMERRARKLLDMVGLTGFENRFPHELSGGMRQRVSICRALLHDPILLLMDEPFGALDALTRDQLNIDLLRFWQESRKTVLFVTHSVPEAVFLSDRVIIMSPRPGQIVDIVEIDLPRPRSLAIRQTMAFAECSQRISRAFEAMGVLREP